MMLRRFLHRSLKLRSGHEAASCRLKRSMLMTMTGARSLDTVRSALRRAEKASYRRSRLRSPTDRRRLQQRAFVGMTIYWP